GQTGVNPAAQQIMNRLTNPQGLAGQQPPGGMFPGGAPPGNGGGSSPFTNGPAGTTSGPFGNGPGNNSNSPFSGGGGGTFIAGVASKAEGEGIKSYNDHTKYKEWEFTFDFKKFLQNQQQAGLQAGQQNATGQGQTNSPFQTGSPLQQQQQQQPGAGQSQTPPGGAGTTPN